ncbi:Na/Pi cotransporter family protein [bacterium]|nr:Na/Pi cotransporter family protein [bacterium]MCP5462855.1 Na/Pi cotransporter family protein [bacterium]
MRQDLLFGVIGGLGLFIFGMRFLSDGLQRVASSRLKKIVTVFTDKPLMGILSGCFVTMLLQSSSVTTVITVGFVNSGILLLRQAIGVIIGANIGTTITAQIIAFKVTKFALPIIGIGCVIYLFGQKKKTQLWGQVMLGFGILFLGLMTMSDVLKPLKDSQLAHDFFVKLSYHPLLAIMIGTLVTFVVQSSSASIGLVIVLAQNGLIDFPAAIYLVLGDNIGTTITAWIASIGSNLTSKRVAMAHSMFNLIGASYFAFLTKSGLFIHVVDYLTPGSITVDTIARNIANAHSLFNITNAIVFFPFIGLLEKLVKTIVRGREEEAVTYTYLEKHLLETPEIALEQAKKEMLRMLILSQRAVCESIEGFFNKDRKTLSLLPAKEDEIDGLQGDITAYLVEISKQDLTSEQSAQLPTLLHSVNDIEKIGDHAENIMNIAYRVIDNNLELSRQGDGRLRRIYSEIQQMFEILIQSFEKQASNIPLKNLFKIEQELNKDYRTFGQDQIRHLQRGKTFVLSGVVFLDMLSNMEKIGDHLTNVAEAVVSDFQYHSSPFIYEI